MNDNSISEFIILRAGYNNAINDVMNIIDKTDLDELNKQVIRDKILRKQKLYLVGNENTEYEGCLYKFYDKENNIGYIIYDDIYELKGVSIFINDGNYTELDDKEIIHIKNNYEVMFFESFSNKDLMNLRFEEWLSRFNKIK